MVLLRLKIEQLLILLTHFNANFAWHQNDTILKLLMPLITGSKPVAVVVTCTIVQDYSQALCE